MGKIDGFQKDGELEFYQNQSAAASDYTNKRKNIQLLFNLYLCVLVYHNKSTDIFHKRGRAKT